MSMSGMMNDALLVFGGFMMGLLVGWISRPKRKARRHEAPVPASYTYNINPRHGEKVTMCGTEWTII